MQITEKKIKVSELCQGYMDDDEGGVYGYSGRLTIRPSFQREFIYEDKKRDAVICTVRKGFPLNVMYWSKIGDDQYEIIDGQQRTISICRYVNGFTMGETDPGKFKGSFSIREDRKDLYFQNLCEDEKQQILDYELIVYVCEGTESEKLEWFRIINIAGEVLNNQELLNATYTGSWISDAKKYFSKKRSVAVSFSSEYLKGNSVRQDYLEKALTWIADRDGCDSVKAYMARHQHDHDANELWLYFQTVINWAKTLFPVPRKGLTDAQEWGLLYNKYKDFSYNSNLLEADIKRLLLDDDVTKKSGIIPYLLSPRMTSDEKNLSIRAFTESQKLSAYERQQHKCACCHQEFAFEEMQGDHIIPWSQGGKTKEENLQMLCQKCNNDKRDR